MSFHAERSDYNADKSLPDKARTLITKARRKEWSFVWRHCGQAWEELYVTIYHERGSFCTKCGRKVFAVVTRLGQGGKRA